MRRTSKVGISALMVVLAASVCCAMYGVSDKGTWPNTWPAELEPLRNQSRTLTHSNSGNIYEIPLTSREQFETVWPHILKLKSEEAPITLLSSPDDFCNMGKPIKAGVRILSPLTGSKEPPEEASYPLTEEAASKMLKIGPPWPDDIKSKSGALPEYVVVKDGKWVPYTDKQQTEHRMRRARIEIQLIVDGDIVDLNRIPLPPNTPIIDLRFKMENHKTDN
jgi:hypothetical protein